MPTNYLWEGDNKLMKYIGKIDDIIFDGRFILRTTFKPKIGTTVMNKHKKKLGRISQIIGPVNKPFVTIKPEKNIKSTFDLIGSEVYIE
jgi:rRNA processing protein Gar1